MNRIEIHQAPKHEVIAHLRSLGHQVENVPRQAGFDFLVDGQIRLTLRVANLSSMGRRVRVGGRDYTYACRAWNFNFPHCGTVGNRSDVFVCLPLVPGQNLDLARSFVIPWEAVSSRTFYLPDSRRAYAGKFATYRNAWEQIRRRPAGEPAAV